MARGWRILDASSLEGEVDGAPGKITLTSRDGHVQHVPAAEAALLIIGRNVSVTAAAIHYLTKHDVTLLAADWRGVPIAGLYPWNDHGRVAARHLAQASLSQPRRKNAWMKLIQAKIDGQAATLSSVDSIQADRLRAVARSVRSGDPMNAEGTAARMYWSRLFSKTSFGRDQAGEDNLNAMLNYGYMVLRGYGVRAVLSAGLSPPLGLFHRGRSNYFNLVDDLIEPFRPAVDSTVVALGAGASLQERTVKHALVASAAQPFTPDGYRIPAVLEALAQHLGRYVEGAVERLVVPHWHGAAETSTESASALGIDDDLPW